MKHERSLNDLEVMQFKGRRWGGTVQHIVLLERAINKKRKIVATTIAKGGMEGSLSPRRVKHWKPRQTVKVAKVMFLVLLKLFQLS